MRRAIPLQNQRLRAELAGTRGFLAHLPIKEAQLLRHNPAGVPPWHDSCRLRTREPLVPAACRGKLRGLLRTREQATVAVKLRGLLRTREQATPAVKLRGLLRAPG